MHCTSRYMSKLVDSSWAMAVLGGMRIVVFELLYMLMTSRPRKYGDILTVFTVMFNVTSRHIQWCSRATMRCLMLKVRSPRIFTFVARTRPDFGAMTRFFFERKTRTIRSIFRSDRESHAGTTNRSLQFSPTPDAAHSSSPSLMSWLPHDSYKDLSISHSVWSLAV